jgi:hypothetical protein
MGIQQWGDFGKRTARYIQVFPIHEVKGLCEHTEGLAMSQPLDVKMIKPN